MVRVVDCHAGVLGSNPGGPKDFPLGIISTISHSFSNLGLKSALLACCPAFKIALLACCRALKVPFSWKLYHALFVGWGNTTDIGSHIPGCAFVRRSDFIICPLKGVCSYVQKHAIDALEGFSQFLANEVSKVRNTVFVIVFIFGFINCNVVLLDANTANFGSTSLALTASIFTLPTYIGIVIVNSVLCRKNHKCLH